MQVVETSPTMGETEDMVRRYGDSVTGQFRDYDLALRNVRVKDWENCPFLCTPPEIGVDLPHHTLLSAIGFTRAALLRTHRQFEMVTGSDRILHTLEEEFRLMLTVLMKNRGNARVIILGQPGAFRQLAEEYAETLQVKQGMSSGPVAHFFTSDENVCRVEKPHVPLDDAMDAAGLPAVYYPNAPGRTQGERGVFNRYWRHLSGEQEAPPPRRRWWSFGRTTDQA